MSAPPKPFVCIQCHQSFFGKDNRTGNPTSRYPLILFCGHTACLMCLKTSSKNHKFFCCPICQKETPLPEGELSVNKLPPDLYVLGVLTLTSKAFSTFGNRDSRKQNQASTSERELKTPTSLESYEQNGVTSVATCEECSLSAKWWCPKCQAHYCGKCFDKVHNASKCLKKHKGVPLHAQGYRSMVQRGCSVHTQSPVEFFCNDDSTLICGTCAVQGNHKGHDCISLIEKNNSCLLDLKPAMDEAQAVRFRIKHSMKKLDELKQTIIIDVVPKEQEIRESFHQLHAALQVRESELLKQLQEYSNCSRTQLDSMMEELSTNVKEVTAHLADAKILQKCTYTAINAVSLISELKSAKNRPAFVVPTGEPESTINVHMSQKLFQHIKQAGTIDADIYSRFKLLPESELPDNYVVEPIADEIATDTESSPSINGSTMEVTLAPSDSSETKKPTKFRFLPPKNSKILRHENVNVVHIVDPSCFYVQYLKNSREIHSLMENIQRVSKSLSKESETPTIICEGLVYLVKYEDEKWYRAKVQKVLSASCLDIFDSDKSKETIASEGNLSADNKVPVSQNHLLNETENSENSLKSQKTESLTSLNGYDQNEELSVTVTPDQLVHVMYMDFGNLDVVTVSNIRNIPSKLMNHPFFVHECALWDILPYESATWSQESISVFGKFVNNHKLLMSIIEEHSGTLYVDLHQPAHFDVSNDVPVSVREALIFMDLAQYPNVGASREAHRTNYQKYFPPESIQPGDKMNIMITHIENPGDFYIMLQGVVASYFYVMSGELQKYYSGVQGDLLTVFAPREGQPYVALYPEDQKWYRAIVEKRIGGSKVLVKFVDYGNKSVVPHWNLRKIVDQFIKVPVQAVQCVMADVAPIQQNWDKSCTDWLAEETRGKVLEMVVHRQTTGDMHVVSLFTWEEKCDICINALLVQNELARSTGPGSVMVTIPRLELVMSPPARTLQDASPSFQNDVKAIALSVPVSEIIPLHFPVSQPVLPYANANPSKSKEGNKSYPFRDTNNIKKKTRLQTLREANKALVQSSAPNSEVNQNTAPKTGKTKDKSKGLPVQIVKFENPGCFYTQRVEEKTQLKKLMTDLQNYHESDENEYFELKEETLVVALNPEDHNSFRARIKSINTEKQTVKIFLLDYGCELEVPQSNLKALPPKFCSALAYATCCHLVGLVPAGGGKNWTRSSCDFAQEQILNFPDQFLVIKKASETTEAKHAIPVDILLKEVTMGGALEPSRTKYHSLTELLIDNGYALSEEKIRLRNSKRDEPSVKQTQSEVSESETESILGGSTSQGTDSELMNLSDNALSESNLVSSADVETDWKPSPMPTKATFCAYPSYVGYDGCIYVHEKGEPHETLENISTTLCNIFSHDLYQRPKKLVRVGQICVARFNVDGKWYRGKVHKVADGCLEVIFVDYGNMELVSFEDVRLFASHLDVPIQCYECELHNVRPVSSDGQWPTSTLDFIHKAVVEKLVMVIVKEPPVPGKRLKVNVMLTGGDTMTELLVKEKLAHIVQPNLMLLSGAIENPYKCLPNPNLGCTFRVVVTHLIDPSLVCVQRPKTDTPSDLVEMAVNEQHDAFLEMISTLSESAHKQPPLRKLSVGQPCLGQYSFDGYWYRCVIVECDEEKATVVFIDYGNSESITLSSKRLRKMPAAFMTVSAQALTCRLHGIVSPEGEWTLPAHQAMSTLLFPSDVNMVELTAQVMDCREPIEIILTEQGNSSQPIYQSLIDENILTAKTSMN